MNGIRNLQGCTLLVVLLSVLVSVAGGRTIYVDANATGVCDGSSWADAYHFLQDALADANSGAKPAEIWVAQGVYEPDEDSLHPSGTGDRVATFRLISGVALRGGYAGFGAPDPNARDVGLYKTILNGDLLGNDGELSEWRYFGYDPNRSDNCYHVVTAIGTNAGTVLDGFVLTGGNATAYYHADAGGGMFNEDSSIELVDCTFVRNHAMSDGAMFNSNSSLNLVTCTFEHNGSSAGPGAVGNYGSSLSLSGCVFMGNLVAEEAGPGGGIHSSNSVLALDGCRFVENFGYYGGGGMSNFESEVIVSNCMFRDNWVFGHGGGGGMFNDSTKMHVSNCVFMDNATLNSEGAGIQNCWWCGKSSSGVVSNCIFTGNAYGGGMDNTSGGELNIHNCVFVGNSGWWGLYSDGPVSNCILWNNRASGGRQVDGWSVQFCNVQGGWPGEGNIDVDPCFVDIGHWDDNGTPEVTWDDSYVSGDYHLKSQAGRYDPNTQSWLSDELTSPCIDAGDPMSPIGHEPFPNGGIINMGAYGGTAEASKSHFGKPPCETIVAGDINGDCEVSFPDFTLMALHWMMDNSP